MKDKAKRTVHSQGGAEQTGEDPVELKGCQLFYPCSSELLDFQSTDELTPLEGILGQQRATDAIELGIGMGSRPKGFNLYVMGSMGLGKREIVRQLLAQQANQEGSLSDWCYVNNFSDPYEPWALQIPAGTGKRLQHWVRQLISEIQHSLPAIMKGDEIIRREDEIHSAFSEKQAAAYKVIEDKAHRQHQVLKQTKTGYSILPEKDGKVLSAKEFKMLPPKERQAIDQISEELRRDMVSMLKQVPLWEKETREQIAQLEREFADITLEYLVGRLPSDLSAIPSVKAYVAALKESLLDNIHLFIVDDSTENNGEEQEQGIKYSDDPLLQYEVHLIVDNSKQQQPPVVYENNPTFVNLIGHIEHRGELGTLITHFTLIRPGALHRANGGFLMLDIMQVLSKPFAWEAFKRALFAREICIESLEKSLGFTTVSTLKPAPIPLDVKVVLMGSRMIYYLLKHCDPEFSQMFKLQADCAEDIARDPETCRLYARLLHSLQQQAQRRALSRDAVARVIEFSAREVEDSTKLTLNHGVLNSLLEEADFAAQQRGESLISAQAVHQALDARQQRCGYLKERVYEQLYRGINQVMLEGRRIGQINGLSVLALDENSFGQPVRITATVYLGQNKVVNIEREVDWSGASHSKGVMTLAAFLRARYGQSYPLSLDATLTFEQSYGPIDGDSASAAELCVLLSAIAMIPLNQHLALTGAIDQHGFIEAIGGVNEKIEGFFEVCQGKGLTGEQGVILPQTNMSHLMLSQAVRDAVSAGQFHLWAVSHVDQAMTLLTDCTMGQADKRYRYPAGSINRAIVERIQKMNRARQKQLVKEKSRR